jgi:hypothetical protein
MTQYEYLKDSTFLKSLNTIRLKEYYCKITSLNFIDESEVETIEGLVTSGTFNVDGSSAIRRTASLNIFCNTEDKNIQEFKKFFGISKKAKIEIGFENTTAYYNEYKILWFPMGIYVITGVNISHDVSSGISASVQLKDKMCLLNGDFGGTIPAATDLDYIEEVDADSGEIVSRKATIFQTIQELVNHYGGEQLGKIIISDLNTETKQVVQWNGTSTAYVISTNIQNNEDDNAIKNYTLTTNKPENEDYILDTFYQGDYIGYSYTDFVYPSSDWLSVNAGESVVSALDKIKSALGNYEYFYDLDGNFVWQEIKNYQNTSKATVDLQNSSEGDYLIDISGGNAVYSFEDSSIISSYTNTPKYEQVKNDFVIWGVRTEGSGDLQTEHIIRYHLAIDSKPYVKYSSISTKYTSYINNYNLFNAIENFTEEEKQKLNNYVLEEKNKSIQNINNNLIIMRDSLSTTQKELVNEINTIIINIKENIEDEQKRLEALIQSIKENIENIETQIQEKKELLSLYQQDAENNGDKISELQDDINSANKEKSTYTTKKIQYIKIYNYISVWSEDSIKNEKALEIYINNFDAELTTEEIEDINKNYLYTLFRDEDDNLYLPKYYNTISDLPIVGEINEYYVILDTNDVYSYKTNSGYYISSLNVDNINSIFKEIKSYDSKVNFPLISQVEDSFDSKIGYLDTTTNIIYSAVNGSNYILDNNTIEQVKVFASDWRTQIFLQNKGQYAQENNVYYDELCTEWTKLYQLLKININNNEYIYTGILRPEVVQDPYDIDYFVDIIDSGSDFFNEINVSNIGRRSLVEQEDSINCIFAPEPKDWIILNKEENNDYIKKQCNSRYESYIEIDEELYEDCIFIGDKYYSAYDEVKNLLYTYTSYNSTVTLVCLPVFYLEPNIRITIRDTYTDIFGDYMLNNYSIQLGSGNTMNISCSQVIETI